MRTKSGKRMWLWLTDCLILANSEYSLISVGRLASELQISTTYGPSGCHMTYPDGTVVTLAALDDVLVLPDADATPPEPCCPAVVVGAEGAQNVPWECIHRRFNHRPWDSLKHLPECLHDSPRSWAPTLKTSPTSHCDECLRAKADAVPSFSHLPPVTEPGSISYDVWTASVGHVHGGQTEVIGFTDQYSTVTKYYLLDSQRITAIQDAIDKYCAWCRSYNVTPSRFHTDNHPSLSGPTMRQWLYQRHKIHLTVPIQLFASV